MSSVLAEIKYIIKINNTYIQEGFEHFSHKSHESRWGIRHSRWHDQQLIKALINLKCSLLPMSLSYSDLMIATLQIQFTKIFNSS